MKKLILLLLSIPFVCFTGFKRVAHYSTNTNLVQVRGGDWPINLEKDTEKPGAVSYSLIFRDQSIMNAVVLDTLPFTDLGQLKYFEQALSALKKGNNGDIAKFKDYSIKRAEKKFEGVWYILRYQWGLTDFQQPEADIMINTIRGL
ncbi:MAG TPA: hypothetical protein VMH01_02035 [Puia sp.]|nr:hypothetical protein [Puia sp.]